MKLLPNARTKRRAALAVLMLWLFAVATGWANACVLEARGTHVHAAAIDASEAGAGAADSGREVTISAGHVSAVADHDEDPDVFKAPCLKLCDDGSTSVVQVQPGLDLTDPGTAPLAVVVWMVLAPTESALRRWDDLRPPEAGPPPRVRFSRLTL